MLRKLKLVVRVFKKRIIISRETKARGGIGRRNQERELRISRIKSDKGRALDDLDKSWTLREIRRPSLEDLNDVIRYGTGLTWKRIKEMQKTYWGGNI